MQGTFASLGQELRELGSPGPRVRTVAMATLAVVLSVAAALALHLDNVWWAGISAFMSTQATRPDSIRRGFLRMAGTVTGAVAGFVMTPWLAYDHVACFVFVFVFSLVGGVGVLVSPHGYAWLFFGITTNLVLLSSLTAPLSALNLAVYRVAEVGVGTITAILVAICIAPDDPAPAAPPAPGWTNLWGGTGRRSSTPSAPPLPSCCCRSFGAGSTSRVFRRWRSPSQPSWRFRACPRTRTRRPAW